MSLRSRGRNALNRRMGVSAGVAVSYVRGAARIEIAAEDGTAWVGQNRFSQQAPTPGGASLIWGDRDYKITVAVLAALGEPQEGDCITETINGTTVTFRVQQPDNGEPCFRYADPGRTVYRIHVKRL